MVNITKREAEFLREKGYSEFVKHSYSKHKKYYLVEEVDDVYRYNKYTKQKELIRLSAMNALKEYRESCKVKEVG